MKTIYFGESQRILIWGTTYPELSKKYVETVCTGGVLEDGRPVRLYPIPLRYLDGSQHFHHYQWITARIAKSHHDPRPESYKIDTSSIEVHEQIKSNPKNEWAARAQYMFRNKDWQFDSMDDLMAANQRNGTSIGIITPREFIDIQVVNREDNAAETFAETLEGLRKRNEINAAQQDFFNDSTATEVKDLEYMPQRLQLHWRCGSPTCGTSKGHALHKMQILDWGTMELIRQNGIQKAMDKVASVCDPEDYDIRLFLGNLFEHPNRFSIVGLWYPKRVDGMLRFED